MKMKTLIATMVLMFGSAVVWAADSSVHSLRGDVALDAPSVQASPKEWREGEGKIPRNYAQQPPLVPHSVEDFAITREDNSCLACHNWNADMEGATKVGISHFVNRDGDALANISPNRYFCTQCHVPQKDAKPLIQNLFKSLAED